jgi:hypothetical protein
MSCCVGVSRSGEGAVAAVVAVVGVAKLNDVLGRMVGLRGRES